MTDVWLYCSGELFDFLVVHGCMKETEARQKFRQVMSCYFPVYIALYHRLTLCFFIPRFSWQPVFYSCSSMEWYHSGNCINVIRFYDTFPHFFWTVSARVSCSMSAVLVVIFCVQSHFYDVFEYATLKHEFPSLVSFCCRSVLLLWSSTASV